MEPRRACMYSLVSLVSFVRTLILLAVAVVGALAMSACSLSTGGTGDAGGATGGGTPTTTTATPTPKPAPTGVPEVTVQYCQGLMTVAEANQAMNPPAPATTIDAQSDSELGVCSYTSAQTPFPVVKILLERKAYTGPKPVPQSTIDELVAELANDPGATVTTTAAISGVGDQAEFLAANVRESNLTFYADVVYVLYGSVVFLCDDFHLGSKPDDATQQSELQQCAQLVVSRL
jgi:hypothetical protein